MGLNSGDRFADRYVVESTLGEGGMGVVVRARDERLHRSVAVKVLAPAAVGDAVARTRLLREARAVAQLEHPGIVHVYDVGETDDGGAYLVMELVRGRDGRAVFGDPQVTPQERLRVIAEAARALKFAHDRGLVHRDVKPDNLMVRDDGRVTVLDFGLAKPISRAVDPHAKTEAPHLTEQGAIAGTPAYLAPEQALAMPLDASADQFALAVTAYEALTGRLPWRGDSTLAVVAAILRDRPISIRELAPELPVEAEGVFTRALAKDPADRYPDIVAFADALNALGPALSRAPPRPASLPPPRVSTASSDLANARTVSAPAESLGAPVAPRTPRRTTPAWRIATLGGIAATGGLVLLWTTILSPSRPPSSTSSTAAPRAVPAEPSSLLACPAFRATGLQESTEPGQPDAGSSEDSWLGAAAAAIACARVQAGLAERDDLVRGPAELAGLPSEPKDSFPADPFEAAGARARAVAEASKLGADWLDGTVALRPDGFAVDLGLRRSDGSEVAHAVGQGRVLFQAVRAAMAPLLQAGRLRQAPDDDMHLVDWTGATTAGGARALTDIAFAIVTEDEVATRLECAATERFDLTEPARFFARAACADRLFEPRPAWPHPLDTSRAALEGMSNHELFAIGGTARKAAAAEGKRAVADVLAERGKLESDSVQAASLAAMAAELYNEAGRQELAATEARRSIQASPKQFDLRAFAWHRLAFTTEYRAEVAASHTAWVPWEPVAALNVTDLHADMDVQLHSARRAFLLGPRGYYPEAFGSLLLQAGETQEAENVASRSGSEWLPVAIRMSRLDFAGAMDAARAMVLGLPQTRSSANRIFLGMTYAVAGAIILGRDHLDFADEIVKRYIDPEPPLLSTNAVPFTGAVLMCTYAPKATGKRCLTRLDALYRGGKLTSVMGGVGDILQGARQLVDGHGSEAASIWAPLLRDRAWLLEQVRLPLVAALDASGTPRDLALADQIDAPVLARRGMYGGIDLAHVRAARRALRLGDRARAHELAGQVLKAWGTLHVPLLDEIEAIFEKTR